MKLKIRVISDPGNLDKERVSFQVLTPIDIGNYALLINKFSDQPTTDIMGGYWFPFGDISIGDKVVLYTKKGVDKHREAKDGGSTYFYYWGLEKSVWGDATVAALLLEAPKWEIYTEDDLAPEADDSTIAQ